MYINLKYQARYFCFLCFAITLTAAQDCPPAEDILPCTCFGKGQLRQGHCGHIQGVATLEKAVKGFQETHLNTFSLFDSNIDYLPHDIFENITITNLRIMKTNMTRIGNLGEPQFKGLESSLEYLSITECFKQKNPFTFLYMDHLKKLKTLILSKNHLEVLHNEWFSAGPLQLSVVRFSQAAIRRVGYKALQKLASIRAVDLSENNIDFLTRSMLPDPAVELQEINLERNKLHSFPEDFFSGMPSLRKVNLELNEFSTIDQNIWGSVWNHLELLNIDYNPLHCDSKIKWLFDDGKDLEGKLVAMCFKPYTLSEREIHTLTIEDLK